MSSARKDDMQHIKREHLRALASSGNVLSAPTLRLLVHIDENADASGRLISRRSKLAEAVGVSMPQITSSLRQLFRTGVLIRRHLPGQEVNVQFAPVAREAAA